MISTGTHPDVLMYSQIFAWFSSPLVLSNMAACIQIRKLLQRSVAVEEITITFTEQLKGNALPEYAVTVLLRTLLMNTVNGSRHQKFILDQVVK